MEIVCKSYRNQQKPLVIGVFLCYNPSVVKKHACELSAGVPNVEWQIALTNIVRQEMCGS